MSPKRPPAVFMDRDGTLSHEVGYVNHPSRFRLYPWTVDAVRAINKAGWLAVVVTNQAGIGRGYYTEADFKELTAWMLSVFRARGIQISRVYHCPYHPSAGVGEYRRDSFDRKPQPGMLLKARDELGLDLGRSVLVGDKPSDIEAGRAAGVGYLMKLVDDAAAARLEAGGAWPVQDLRSAAARLLEISVAGPVSPPG